MLFKAADSGEVGAEGLILSYHLVRPQTAVRHDDVANRNRSTSEVNQIINANGVDKDSIGNEVRADNKIDRRKSLETISPANVLNKLRSSTVMRE
jgi:hypothetical protein